MTKLSPASMDKDMAVKPNLPQIFSNPNTRVQHDIFFATGVMAANIVEDKNRRKVFSYHK